MVRDGISTYPALVTVVNQHGGDLLGGAGSQILIGSGAGEKLSGGGGNDLIFGRGGDDTLIFHQDDTLDGGGDTVATAGGLTGGSCGDVLVLDHSTDLTAPNLDGKLTDIETISLLNSESGASGLQKPQRLRGLCP